MSDTEVLGEKPSELGENVNSDNRDSESTAGPQTVNEPILNQNAQVQSTEPIPENGAPENSTLDVNMEANVETTPSTIENRAIQSNLPTSKPIGSLGLLNQYASSSDEDEDSSSSEDEGGSEENENESDDTDETSSIEVIEEPTNDDTQLDSAAKSILDSVMSRENYRDVSSDS